jgi:hypothetical protein
MAMSEPEPTAIIVRPNVLPTTAQFTMMRDLSERLAYAVGFLPDHFFQGDPQTRKHRILAAIEYGRAVGIEPMIALQNITMINGKAGASALLIGALVRRGGYEITDETSDERSVVTITKQGKVTGRGEFSIQDAKTAGLVRSGGGWEKYRRDMLYARALTQAARRGAQDAMLGLAYTSEELGVETDEDGQAPTGEVVAVTPAVDQDGVIANPSVESLKAAQQVAGNLGAALPSSGPTPIVEPPAVVAAERQTPRSIGPRAKRGNVVAAPILTPEAGQAKPEVLSAPAPSVASQSLTDGLDDGQEQYLISLRQQAREAAAILRQLRVRLLNHENRAAIALGTASAMPLPPSTPNTDSDDSLTAYIADANGPHPGKTLQQLSENELGAMLGKFEELTKRVEQKLK